METTIKPLLLHDQRRSPPRYSGITEITSLGALNAQLVDFSDHGLDFGLFTFRRKILQQMLSEQKPFSPTGVVTFDITPACDALGGSTGIQELGLSRLYAALLLRRLLRDLIVAEFNPSPQREWLIERLMAEMLYIFDTMNHIYEGLDYVQKNYVSTFCSTLNRWWTEYYKGDKLPDWNERSQGNDVVYAKSAIIGDPNVMLLPNKDFDEWIGSAMEL